ncbi:MAG: hypothetical protein HRT53_09475 [Colwellia sp.]|nr:hypothetical protein [Colwellia sp.]
METQLFEEIKEQTLQAIELAESNEIEQCNVILSSRQQSLNKLQHDYLSHSNEKDIYKKKLIELFLWVQIKDAPVIQKLEDKKEEFKQIFLTQNKTNKALKHYKNMK